MLLSMKFQKGSMFRIAQLAYQNMNPSPPQLFLLYLPLLSKQKRPMYLLKDDWGP